MQRNIAKRFLSLVLVFCLLTGMIPAQAVAASAENTEAALSEETQAPAADTEAAQPVETEAPAETEAVQPVETEAPAETEAVQPAQTEAQTASTEDVLPTEAVGGGYNRK